MNNLKLKNIIFETLKKDERIWNKNFEELNLIKLLDLVGKLDEKIITLLLHNELLKEKFFIKIDSAYVFKTNDFLFFMEENKVYNSYTQYKNRIGLTDGKRFIKDTNDVVLNFPFKDCILEGGQSTEEGMDTYFEYSKKTNDYEKKQSKRKEIFFNQVLAQDEIDRLLDEKAFVNWKRYTQNGEEDVKEINRNGFGTIKENLIIKGNNLLALHSLKKQFSGKVKLIYIDPPYNTGNDEFKYNDNFNHSTWLTFMKNRLEVAKQLLKNEGVIFVQCDDNEQAYLKVLMDEIFGVENFVNCIAVKMAEPTGVKMSHSGKKLPKIKEYLLIYKRNQTVFRTIKIPKEKWDTEYKIFVNNVRPENITSLKNIIGNDGRTKDDITQADKICSEFEFITISEVIKKYNIQKSDLESWMQKNAWRIVRTVATNESVKKLAYYKKKTLNQSAFTIITPQNKMYVVKSDYDETAEQPRIKILFADDYLSISLGDFWWDIKTTGLEPEGGVKLLGGKKPEQLIQRIIDMSTQHGDIVLDFFMGTGTTCAVAHKMNRQYIGIEQLDYGENSAVERLKNVIKGDQTGISKAVNWQVEGGGDFIYFELAKWNDQAKELINNCSSLEELENLFDNLYENYFLNYNLKIKEFKEKVIKEENFKALSLEKQKKMFLTMLDLNQMYIQKTEMTDKKYNVDDKDQELTLKFYDGK